MAQVPISHNQPHGPEDDNAHRQISVIATILPSSSSSWAGHCKPSHRIASRYIIIWHRIAWHRHRMASHRYRLRSDWGVIVWHRIGADIIVSHRIVSPSSSSSVIVSPSSSSSVIVIVCHLSQLDPNRLPVICLNWAWAKITSPGNIARHRLSGLSIVRHRLSGLSIVRHRLHRHRMASHRQRGRHVAHRIASLTAAQPASSYRISSARGVTRQASHRIAI